MSARWMGVVVWGLLIAATGQMLGQMGPIGDAASKPASPVREFFEEPDYEAVCRRALADPLPPAAAALVGVASEGTGGGGCDEQELYYGFGRPPRYAEALRCAYWHRAHPTAKDDGFLDGAGTLAMLYANGDGVGRDYPLAIRFACEANEQGGQNTEQRIGVLEALRDGKLPAGTVFDVCDEQMSGVMGAYCSDLREKLDDVGRARRLEAVKSQLPAAARALLATLQADETNFEQERMRGEYTGGGGSGSVGFALDDQGKLREQFVRNLERFNKGDLLRATVADREQAERELGKAYDRVRGLPVEANPVYLSMRPPTQEGFARTEAAWQTLFAEWMRFAAVAYPGLSQDAVATELLRLRIHQLKRVSP